MSPFLGSDDSAKKVYVCEKEKSFQRLRSVDTRGQR